LQAASCFAKGVA